MAFISGEPAPSSSDDELRAYLDRMFSLVNIALTGSSLLQVSTRLPAKPVKGGLYYFSVSILPHITSEGYWGYTNNWVKLG